jgi:hypothetical protein
MLYLAKLEESKGNVRNQSDRSGVLDRISGESHIKACYTTYCGFYKLCWINSSRVRGSHIQFEEVKVKTLVFPLFEG